MTLILDPDDPAGWREAPPAPAGAPSSTGSHLTDGLNPQQREAVEYRGPALLIVAGAGSGKTRVLTHRIASLIESREAWPSQILAITFTNKAAAEMRERVEALLGEGASGMWISTFHSACVRILRREAEAIGLSSTFTIYDSADQRTILKRIIKELDADTMGFTPASAQAKISKLKNELADVETFARNANMNDPQEVMFLEIFRQYTRRLRDASALDFDDLIAETVYLFRAFPKVAALYQRRFRHILVDEYQDTNHAQYSLIREFTRPVPREIVDELDAHGILVRGIADDSGAIPGASLTVVGDSDQSIYAFRGADIRNISEFERDFTGAKVVLLEQNYRSTQNILSAANAVISNNFDRKDKKLWTADGDGDPIVGYTGYTAHDEAQFVADEIESLHRTGVAYRDIAVFYRTNAQTRALEEIFVRSALPYRVVGGTKFYERAEIKDAMAYLIAVANPLDELALRRILNTPKRGIGPATETALASFAEQNELTFRAAMRAADGLGLGPKVTGAISALAAVLDEAAAMLVPSAEGMAAGTNQGASKVSDVLVFLRRALGAARDPAQQPRPARRDPRRERRRARRPDPRLRPREPRRDPRRLPHPGVARRRRRRDRRRVGHRLADDPAHRQGPRVPRRVPHRPRRGAAAPPDVGVRAGRAGRRAAPLLRRHHPRAQAPAPLARDEPRPVRRGRRGDAVALPAGDPRGAHRLAAVARHGDEPRRHPAARAQRTSAGRRVGHPRPRPRAVQRHSLGEAQDRVGQPRHRQRARQRRPHPRGRRPHPPLRLRRGQGHPGHRRGHQAHRARELRHRRAEEAPHQDRAHREAAIGCAMGMVLVLAGRLVESRWRQVAPADER